MMTLAEVEFIKAELTLNEYNIGSTTMQHYETGISASMTQWGASMPAGFVKQTGVLFDVNATSEKQLEQIMLQKYMLTFLSITSPGLKSVEQDFRPCPVDQAFR